MQDVADRANVSRGAQTHHYATKHELVVAAIEHLFDEQARRFVSAFEAIPPEARTLGRAIDELWAIEWKYGRMRLKSSFGTALKVYSPKSLWANVSTYATRCGSVISDASS